ncbi:glutathione synthetase-like isoform X2 [Halichondria panicea]|uniref:glutathione synthetase-like isoform X2 n=1 Tax=Halichondria panicea TaxID=6063 RepID=UPI00312B5806
MEWWKDVKAIESIRDFALLQALTPFKFPTQLFQHARTIQTHINLLVDAVSQDYQFLSDTLKSVVANDDFTRRLMEIHKKVTSDNKQTCTFSIQRSDYMIDKKPGVGPTLKQIEMNTIAASCFALTQDKMENLFSFVRSRFQPSSENSSIPPNKCLDILTEGIAIAWKEYASDKSCVLFAIDEGETNIYDSRPIEFLLWTKYKIPVIYRSLLELSKQGRLGPQRELLVSGQEVAVVYFRTGYSPEQYPTDKEWDARLLCEMSRASNCPSVGYQLAGTKKVQQALTVPGILEKFCDDSDAVASIRTTFAGIYSLENNAEGDWAIERALKNPADFVVKPQREGGGNNFYDDDVRIFLEGIRHTSEREAYILMDRVHPPVQPGLVLWLGKNIVTPVDLTCELGILGVFLRKQSEVMMNVEGGYILRSKSATTNEVGLNAGFGALDLPTLVS